MAVLFGFTSPRLTSVFLEPEAHRPFLLEKFLDLPPEPDLLQSWFLLC